jgi:hypothetical protein
MLRGNCMKAVKIRDSIGRVLHAPCQTNLEDPKLGEPWLQELGSC